MTQDQPPPHVDIDLDRQPPPPPAPEEDGLAAQFAQWRAFVRRRKELTDADADELEDHLRGSVASLTQLGLRPDEAFLVAVKRMGSLDELSREFAREHSERLWKQLVLTGDGAGPAAAARGRSDLYAMLVCAVGAAISIKAPELFGVPPLFRDNQDSSTFWALNISLLALPWLAAFLAWRRRAGVPQLVVLVALFVLGAVGANAYGLGDQSDSIVLTAIHLPIALWLVVGVAYVADNWRASRRWMDFIRFTGEWIIYNVLLGLGGGVLIAFLLLIFNAIDLNASDFVVHWVMPCGATASVIVAGWLVESKQGVIENLAPVLARIFTPLFTAVLIGFLLAIGGSADGLHIDRDSLILFNLLLVVILGLLLYTLSARDPLAPPRIFDRLTLGLVISALIIDGLVLAEIAGRIADEYGTTPNRASALGENVILLVNLAWSAWLLLAFLRRRRPFTSLERWQTGYLPVYAAWAWIVVFAFPPLFHFR